MMSCNKYNAFHFCRILSVFLTVIIMLSAVSCKENEADDKTMTDTLIENYMDALCKFDIDGINKNSLGKINKYSDNDNVNSTCKLIANHVKWEIVGININGSTAIAHIKIHVPENISDICQQALNDAMTQMDPDADSTPHQLIYNEIKGRLKNAESKTIDSEISMSKIGNKWHISKSPDVAVIISDIRTPTAAIYSMFE